MSPVLLDLKSVWNAQTGFVAPVKVTGMLLGSAIREGFERLIAQGIASLNKKLELHRLLRLRQRYIMTRGNRVRLRYVAASMVVCALATQQAFGPAVASMARDYIAEQEQYLSGDLQESASYLPQASLSDSFQMQISEGIRKASVAVQKSARSLNKEIEIGSGETIAGALNKVGVDSGEAYKIVEALGKHYDPRKIAAGQMIKVNFKPGDEDVPHFSSLTMKIDPVKEVSVSRRGDEDYVAELHEKELVKRSYGRAAKIETSLYGSAEKAGIPQHVIAELIRFYSWDIDFQRDIRRGDSIEVLYDTFETEDGEFAKFGEVLHANLTVGGKTVPIYRFELADGRVDYFEPDGHSIRKALMKTPIDGARISSGFGMRKHPVLGYNKMHKGMDFAAPTGTPIYAAGDATVEFAGRQGGYGNYIRLRHNNSIKTAYAHLHKFAKGMTTGKRVQQGEIIGYVGTTGRSTGPHLHYEVLVNNVQKNPNSIDLPTGEQLAGKDLKNFKSMMTTLRQQYVSLSEGLKFAALRGGDNGRTVR